MISLIITLTDFSKDLFAPEGRLFSGVVACASQVSKPFVLFDFINLTQVHNFTVSAQDIFTFRRLGIYRKFYRNFASTNADNEPFCTVLLASQVVMIQSLQPKGREFESTCFLFYLYSIRLISFIIDVPRPLRNEILDHSISKG